MRLIDSALNHHGLRGLLGLACPDRTRGGKNEKETVRQEERERGAISVNRQSTERCAAA